MNAKVMIPGNDWKYGIGFLLGIVVTLMAISILSFKYSDKNTQQ